MNNLDELSSNKNSKRYCFNREGIMIAKSDDEILLMKIDKLLLGENNNVFIYNSALTKPLMQLKVETHLRLKARSKN